MGVTNRESLPAAVLVAINPFCARPCGGAVKCGDSYLFKPRGEPLRVKNPQRLGEPDARPEKRDDGIGFELELQGAYYPEQ